VVLLVFIAWLLITLVAEDASGDNTDVVEVGVLGV